MMTRFLNFKDFFVFLLLTCLPALLVLPCCSNGISGGRVIIEVDGFPITEKEFYRAYEFHALYWDIRKETGDMPEDAAESRPGSVTEDDLKTRILSNSLIPMAAIKAKYRETIPGLLNRADKIKSMIAPDGSNFGELAAKHSGDTNAESGGNLGTVNPIGLPYPVSMRAFDAEKGEIIGPFLSLAGCHILFIHEKIQGMVPASDSIKASQILLPYVDGKPDFVGSILPRLLEEARVEVVDHEYERYVDVD